MKPDGERPRSVSCGECGAAPGLNCSTPKGHRIAYFHQARLDNYRNNEGQPKKSRSQVCREARVPCWMDCVNPDPIRCDFCGMCSDPDCRFAHNPKEKAV